MHGATGKCHGIHFYSELLGHEKVVLASILYDVGFGFYVPDSSCAALSPVAEITAIIKVALFHYL